MAQSMDDDSQTIRRRLTDCTYFMKGNCKLEENCGFRHCSEAFKQTDTCKKWPKNCRDVTCPYRHPKPRSSSVSKKKSQISNTSIINSLELQPSASPPMPQGLISFFWDIENVPIPRGMKPFDIVQRIRQKLVIEPRLQEAAFSCFCNISKISEENQKSLHLANVRIIHIPDKKPGAADRQIMLELDRFERVHRPPATVVLISGDIDFVGKLSDLRHQAGFHVIVIHNKPAKEELKATVHAHYPWELFTTPVQQQTTTQNNLNSDEQERSRQTAPTRSRSLTRRDLPSIPYNQPLANINQQKSKKKFTCQQCPSTFDSFISLNQHQIAKGHLLNGSASSESSVGPENPTLVENTQKKHVGDYKCMRCNRSFTKLESLNQHQQATGHTPSLSESTNDTGAASREISSSNIQSNNSNSPYALEIIERAIEPIKQYYINRGLLKL